MSWHKTYRSSNTQCRRCRKLSYPGTKFLPFLYCIDPGSNQNINSTVASLTMNLNAVGSNPTVGKKCSFCIFRFPTVPRSSTEPIQMKSSMTFIRCIGRKIILKKMAT